LRRPSRQRAFHRGRTSPASPCARHNRRPWRDRPPSSTASPDGLAHRLAEDRRREIERPERTDACPASSAWAKRAPRISSPSAVTPPNNRPRRDSSLPTPDDDRALVLQAPSDPSASASAGAFPPLFATRLFGVGAIGSAAIPEASRCRPSTTRPPSRRNPIAPRINAGTQHDSEIHSSAAFPSRYNVHQGGGGRHGRGAASRSAFGKTRRDWPLSAARLGDGAERHVRQHAQQIVASGTLWSRSPARQLPVDRDHRPSTSPTATRMTAARKDRRGRSRNSQRVDISQFVGRLVMIDDETDILSGRASAAASVWWCRSPPHHSVAARCLRACGQASILGPVAPRKSGPGFESADPAAMAQVPVTMPAEWLRRRRSRRRSRTFRFAWPISAMLFARPAIWVK